MKRLYLNMVLALTLVATSFTANKINAQAETAGIGWEVTYDGSKITSSYDAANCKISNVMPGDTIEYTVQYNNASGEEANFYMNADVVKSLEEGSEATGGAYSYKITYSGSETPLFDSETVGGDADAAIAKVGLDQVNGNEGSYFSLGSLSNGDHGTVTVAITLDGNSQTNAYMATLAELEIKFGAEPTSSAREGETVEKRNTVVKRVVNTLDGGTEVVIIDDDTIPLAGGDNPLTGDSIMPLLLCGAFLFFGLILIVWYFVMTRNKKEEVA